VNDTSRDTPEGFLYAGGAYAIWGLLPLYFKLLERVPALEILAHRILWSIPIAGAVLAWRGQGGALWRLFADRTALTYTALTSAFLSVNWGIYVWAVVSGRTLEAALGYYINPLFSIFLAAVLLGERLRRLQKAAIGLAMAAVALLTWETGGLPWVSLILPLTWGIYAYLKKIMPVEPVLGFFLEVVLMAPVALAFLLRLESQAGGNFVHAGMDLRALLVGTGFMTAVPLMLYALGAKLLRLSTIAIMQYSAPTVVFLIAVFVFREPFSHEKFTAFTLIWTALALYSWEAFGLRRR
jgi:chloramphenicol-sensitive protein RarD